MAYATRSRASSCGADDVAHAWAHQTRYEMRKGNVFFEGKVIFSYGRHFPMAVLLDNGYVAINSTRYSPTTSAHQSSMRNAVSHLKPIYCPHLPTYDSMDSYAHNKKHIHLDRTG